MTIYIFFGLAGAAVIWGYVKYRRHRRLAFIDSYPFHRSIRQKLLKQYPHLSEEQADLVFKALRDYFWMCNRAKRRAVSMPSQAVDAAWHEFILFTRAYQHFCMRALGRFLHHTPSEAMRTATTAQEGIRRAWRLACARETIDPKRPSRLPLIFAIDGLLNIADGFVYTLNCQDRNSPAYGSGYCAGHIGCTGGCAGDSGAAEDSGSGSGGLFDGDGGGCGGD